MKIANIVNFEKGENTLLSSSFISENLGNFWKIIETKKPGNNAFPGFLTDFDFLFLRTGREFFAISYLF